MAGNATKGGEPQSSASSDELPQLFDDDGVESTVATASPTFDSSVPSPISAPPPALAATPAGGVRATPAGPVTPTAPVPFTPSRPGTAAVPVQRQTPAKISVATPFGGLSPGLPSGNTASAKVSGASPTTGGSVKRQRPQTVIGLAPPPAGAPSPLGASSPRAQPAAPAANAGPGPARAGAAAGPAPDARSAAPIGGGGPAKSVVKDEAPLKERPAVESLALFGADDGLSDAARSAVSAPVAARRAPVAKAQGAVPGLPVLHSPDDGEDVATVAVPREELERRKAAPSGGVPSVVPAGEDEESTRAVPREELVRAQDAHVVVGDDAVGDDATLAVAPANNEANSARFLPFAETFRGDSPGAFPSAPGSAPNLAPAASAVPHPMSAGPGMNVPAWPDAQPSWHPAQGQHRTPSDPQFMRSADPHMPASNPHMPASNPHGPIGHPTPGGQMPAYMAAQSMPMVQGQMPMAYPDGRGGYAGQMPMMRGQQAAPPAAKRSKISGQLIALMIVGVICVAIFATGIYLFVTTRF